MKDGKKHTRRPSIRNTFICGATAAFVAQGCGQDLRHVSEKQMDDIRTHVEFYEYNIYYDN